MLLNERADLYRLQESEVKAGRKELTVLRPNVACHLEPVSAMGTNIPYAVQSTHVITIPHFLKDVRVDDEFQLGYRLAGDGSRQPRRFVVKGLQRYTTFGLRHQAAFCSERV